MMDILAQLRVLAQGDGEGFANLLFIIVVLVLWAVGGLIRATRKGAAQRQGTGAAAGPRRQTETWQQRLERKAQELLRAAEAAQRARRVQVKVPPREQAPRPTSVPGPVMQAPASKLPEGRIVTRPGRGGEPILVYERQKRQGGSIREQLAAQQREARDAVSAAQYSKGSPPAGIEAKVELGESVVRLAAEEPMREAMEPPLPAAQGEVRPEASAELAGLPPDWLFDYRDPDAFRKAIVHYEILGKPIGLRDPGEQSATF